MGERVKLTDTVAAEATCPPGRKDMLLFDSELRGFALRVTKAGGKTFLLQYRVAGVSRRAVIGAWGSELTTAKARKKAETLRGTVRDHRDPVAERRRLLREQREAEAKAKAEAAAAAAASAFTVGRLIEQWAALKLVERSASYRARVPRELRRALSDWLAAPAAGFDHAAAVQVLDDVKAKRGPVAANRLRAVASACWAWSMKRGSLSANPWRSTERPAEETARQRTLSDAEVADLWHAAGTLGFPWCGLLRALLLTGQRRGEVAGMDWAELDLKAAEWRLPAPRVKNRRAHIVPLSPALLALLAEQPRMNSSSLVFEGARGTTPSGFGKVKAKLDKAMLAAAEKEGRPLLHWTLHDIRRTVATGLQRLGVRLEVTEAVLNHASGSRAGIVGVYQTHGWDTEKRAALDAWGARVLALANPAQPEEAVVPADTLAEARAKRARKAAARG
jgi:integrase